MLQFEMSIDTRANLNKRENAVHNKSHFKHNQLKASTIILHFQQLLSINKLLFLTLSYYSLQEL